jgi:hypothetical protein
MLARLSAIMATARLRNVTTARATVAMPVRSMGTGSAQLLSVSRSRTVGAAAGLASKRSVKQSALSARGAARALAGQGVPATCPIGGATADSHGLSRLARQETRRSANPQVMALQRHRLPKLTVRVRFPSPAPRRNTRSAAHAGLWYPVRWCVGDDRVPLAHGHDEAGGEARARADLHG